MGVYMKIVIIGIGTIGHTILKSIDRESHTITVIDENKDKIESVIEHYDVFGVVGNGACREIQKEAEVGSADLVIVLTKSDELNILACLVAKNIGAKNTVARVRNPEYRSQIMDMKESLGISMIVNPEMDTAREIFNLISLEVPNISNNLVSTSNFFIATSSNSLASSNSPNSFKSHAQTFKYALL
jgi:trk system potassium uptake protein TrkA